MGMKRSAYILKVILPFAFFFEIIAAIGFFLGGGGATGALAIAATGTFVAFDAALIIAGLSYAFSPSAPDMPTFGQLGVGAGRTQSVRQPITTHRMVFGEVKVTGPWIFMHSAEDDDSREHGYWYDIRVLACHECDSISEYYINNTLSTDASFKDEDDNDLVRITEHLGTADQTADTNFISEVDRWTSSHRLRGRTYLASRLKFDPDAFPNSIPSSIAGIVKGNNQIYDPRDESTGWSDNPALIAAYYFTLEKSKGGIGAAWSTIDEEALIAAANVCDELISVWGYSQLTTVSGDYITTEDGRRITTEYGGATEKRYTCNGTLDTGVDPWQNLKAILGSMAGDAVPIGGKWIIYAGSYVTPTETFTVDDLRGPISVVTEASKRDKVNGARATFVWPAAQWQPVDAPPHQIASYLLEDEGYETWVDLNLSFTTSSATAQRLQRIAIEKSRRGTTIKMPVKLKGFKVKPGDNIYFTHTRYGWGEKVFQVINWALSEDGGVDLILRETDADIYDWNISYEQELEIPNIVSVADGSVAETGLTIDWGTDPEPTAIDITYLSANLTQVTYEVYFWNGFTWQWDHKNATSTTSTMTGISPTYPIKVVTTSTSGRTTSTSSYPAISTPSGFAAVGGSGKITLSWTEDPDAPTANIYVNTVDNITTATYVTNTSTPYEHTTAGTKYYWIRSMDQYGNISDHTSSVNATAS